MTRLCRALFAGLVALLAAMPALAFEPAVVFDFGGKFDKSFNEGVLTGIERFKKETGIPYRAFEITNDVQREQFLRRLAERGADIILAVGFNFAPSVENVAKDYPKIHFALIDGVVDLPNVQSIVFEEQEGSYLVGMLAAMASKTGTVGFVGGMDIPLIRRFACGYAQGVRSVKPNATVIENMVGATPSAWNDTARGSELAKSQFDRGADVVFHAAGRAGLGALQAAADSNKLGIGVDSNQNGLFPGKVLTSMLKRVDVAAYETFKAAKDGTWKAGIQRLGVKESGVGYALDANNQALITPEMKEAVDKAAAAIGAGTLHVATYSDSGTCK